MGAYNTILVELACPFCGHRQEWTVQFKYGNCWQFEYHVGDKIRWGGNKKGTNTGGYVRSAGLAEERCNGCSRDFRDAAVYFMDNVIQRVELLQQPLKIAGYYESLQSE